MAIPINDIYNTTLTLLNKEQRGYVTPEEFNQVAVQVQREIFEKYFIDLASAGAENFASVYANINNERKQKLEVYEDTTQITAFNETEEYSDFTIPMDTHYILMVYDGAFRNVNKVDRKMIHHILDGPLTAPNFDQPVYIKINDHIRIYPTSGVINLSRIVLPTDPSWIGTSVNGQLIPSLSNIAYNDFQLHASEYPEVVARVLLYFGLQTRSDEVIQVAGTKEAQNSQA